MNYLCVGSVRGWCGHLHRNRESAERCRDRDRQGCKAQDGYSDRDVWRIDVLPYGLASQYLGSRAWRQWCDAHAARLTGA